MKLVYSCMLLSFIAGAQTPSIGINADVSKAEEGVEYILPDIGKPLSIPMTAYNYMFVTNGTGPLKAEVQNGITNNLVTVLNGPPIQGPMLFGACYITPPLVYTSTNALSWGGTNFTVTARGDNWIVLKKSAQ